MAVILFAPVTFNLAETTRMIEVARALGPGHRAEFMGYEDDFVGLIHDAGLRVSRAARPLGAQRNASRPSTSTRAARSAARSRPTSWPARVDVGAPPDPRARGIRRRDRLEHHVAPLGAGRAGAAVLPGAVRAHRPAGRADPTHAPRPRLRCRRPRRRPRRDVGVPVALHPGASRARARSRRSRRRTACRRCKTVASMLEADVNLLTVMPSELDGYDLPDDYRRVGPIFARIDGPLPPIVGELAAEPEPLVYLGLGSSADRRLALAVADVLGTLPVNVVAPIRHYLRAGDVVPANVHVTGLLPAHRLGGLVDAAVLHGGQGTVQTACATGRALRRPRPAARTGVERRGVRASGERDPHPAQARRPTRFPGRGRARARGPVDAPGCGPRATRVRGRGRRRGQCAHHRGRRHAMSGVHDSSACT